MLMYWEFLARFIVELQEGEDHSVIIVMIEFIKPMDKD